jgi:hypothetical protein
MNKKTSLINKLNDHYFWDTDTSKIDVEASKRLIIQRVFSLGSLEDMRTVIAYYGEDIITEELARLNYLDPKTLNFVSILFDKPKEEFRCYTSKSSAQQHWSS